MSSLARVGGTLPGSTVSRAQDEPRSAHVGGALPRIAAFPRARGQDFARYERGLSFGNDEMHRLSCDVHPWRP